MSEIPETRQVRIAICGFGARGRLAYICRVAQDLTDLWSGKPLDDRFRTHDYYDTQSEEDGPGVAFQLQSNAALNTDLPGPISIDTTGLTDDQAATIRSLTDLAAHYVALTMDDPAETLANLEKENVSTAILFALASRGGTLDTSVACGSRNFVGQALVKMTNEAIELQRQHLPWLQVDFHLDVRVTNVDLEDPQKPILTILKNGQEIVLEAYDLLVKTTGTTWEVPVQGIVAEKAFTGIPNSEKLWQYLHDRNVLGPDGLIIPGKRILIGGASLGAFDPVGIILVKTGIVKVTGSAPSGFTIDKERTKQYPGLITFFSRSPNKFVPARHAQVGPLPQESVIFSPEMILSHQLQKNQDPYPIYREMARLVTAMHLRKLPQEVENYSTTNDQLDAMARDNQDYASSFSTGRFNGLILRLKQLIGRSGKQHTEPYMMRAALLSLLFSYALGTTKQEMDNKRAKLVKEYPLLVRNAFDASRSMIFNATHPVAGSPYDSTMAIDKHKFALDAIFQHVTSAPFPIHHLITQLYECGVATWKQGIYRAVSWSEEDNLFHLRAGPNDTTAHCLIASRMLTADTDLLSTRILVQTKAVERHEPVYDKGRFPKSRSNKRVHVIELGIPGHGQRIGVRTLKSQWYDTNSYLTAAHVMPTIATTICILENMFFRNVAVPVDDLMKLHQQTLPPSSDFAEQVEKLREPFEECDSILEFAKLAAKLFPEGRIFAEKMAAAMDKNKRIAMVAEMANSSVLANKYVGQYTKALAEIEFQPHDLESFERTTPDFSSVQIAEMKRIQASEYKQLDEPAESTQPTEPTEPATSNTSPKPWSDWVLWLFWLFIYYLFALALTAAYCHLETPPALGGELASHTWARRLLWLAFSGWLFVGLTCAIVTVPRVVKVVLFKSADLLFF
jgi:hypothetical protein